MPTLKIQFPGRRYHATPWGHHVNEGLIEWPPCPWRMLRALIACGCTSQQWREIPPLAQQLIDKLATVLPSYRIPEASAAHTRHFMPVGKLVKGREQTTLVFDTFADVGDGELCVRWPCELNDDETDLLGELAESLGYLGRSESWVTAELIPDDQMGEEDFNAVPHQEGITHQHGREQLSLVAPVPPEEYLRWKQEQEEVVLAPFPLPEGKKKPSQSLLKKREKAIDPYPPDLLSCLMKDTSWWKQHGWSQPPGSQRALYWRPSNSLQVGVPQRPRRQEIHRVTTMLLSLTTSSGNRSALPPRARTLPQAELIHRSVVALAGKGERVHCPEITGRDEQGNPSRDHHNHAHTIPLDLDGDGRLDHVLIYAKMGLGPLAQRAIRKLRRTWTKGAAGEIQATLVGSGDLEMLRQLPAPFRDSVELILGPPTGSRVWESVTPIVLPRFLKRRGKNAFLGQINAELESRLLPSVEQAEVVPDLTRALRHFVRRRAHGGIPPPVDIGYGARLTFTQPVTGPLLLGYGSHYGLGLFRASDDDC